MEAPRFPSKQVAEPGVSNFGGKPKEYATTDFYLAAFLKAKDLKLISTEREGRRSTFVFEDRPDRVELLCAYYNEGVVEIKAFRHAIEDLKSVVHNW